jgi:hypothetical protein
MSGAAAIAGPSAAQENIYAREVRFGGAMYGGVSLERRGTRPRSCSISP